MMQAPQKAELLASTVAPAAPRETRIFWGVDEFAAEHAISTRQVYCLLQSGALEGRRIGRRTVITEESAAAWRADLPRFESGVPLNAAKAVA